MFETILKISSLFMVIVMFLFAIAAIINGHWYLALIDILLVIVNLLNYIALELWLEDFKWKLFLIGSEMIGKE